MRNWKASLEIPQIVIRIVTLVSPFACCINVVIKGNMRTITVSTTRDSRALPEMLKTS